MTDRQAPTKIDKLFALKAVEKKAEEERKLLEYECRDELIEAFNADGTDRRTSPFFGVDAGKFSLKRFKAKPAKKELAFSLSDDELFAEWLEDNKGAAIEYAKRHVDDFAEWHFRGSGEVADGIEMTETEVPGQPERLTAQVYSFKPDVVLSKLAENGNFLEGANRLLLGDGDVQG